MPRIYIAQFTHSETRRQRAAGILTCRKCLRELPLSAFAPKRRTCQECIRKDPPWKDLCVCGKPKHLVASKCSECHFKSFGDKSKNKASRDSRALIKQKRKRKRLAMADPKGSEARIERELRRYSRNLTRAVIAVLRCITSNADRKARLSRKRAKRRGVVDAGRIDTRLLYAESGGTCWICGERVKRDEFSIDHFIPISRGGKHEQSNVRLAHRWCNSWRRDLAPLIALADFPGRKKAS